MNVLFLTNEKAKDRDYLANFIRDNGDRVVICWNNINEEFIRKNKIDFLISYRYQQLIKEPLLTYFEGRMVNCHPSFLPWCRGYYPNAWSFLDDTPKGVSVLFIDAGIDTGDLIAQTELFFDSHVTLRESYNICHDTIQKLFMDNWNKIREGTCSRIKQVGKGTLHYKKDNVLFMDCLKNGWDTTIHEFKNNYHKKQNQNKYSYEKILVH